MGFLNHANNPEIELPRLRAIQDHDCDNRRAIVTQFFQCLKNADHKRGDVSILLSIQRTADMTSNNDAYVAKVLVEAGLRAPRMAFPGAYLDHILTALTRHPHHMGAAAAADKDLHAHWMAIGDDPFAGYEWALHQADARDLMH